MNQAIGQLEPELTLVSIPLCEVNHQPSGERKSVSHPTQSKGQGDEHVKMGGYFLHYRNRCSDIRIRRNRGRSGNRC
jgi:hypothetical protein